MGHFCPPGSGSGSSNLNSGSGSSNPDFDAGNIHYEGHWKGRALKSRLFWALKWQRAKRVPYGPTKVRQQNIFFYFCMLLDPGSGNEIMNPGSVREKIRIQDPTETSSIRKTDGTNQCCGSALVSIRIRIQHFLSMRIRIQIQGFDDQKLEKIYR